MRSGNAASAQQALTLRDCSAKQLPMRSGSASSARQPLTSRYCSAVQSPMRSGSAASARQPATLMLCSCLQSPMVLWQRREIVTLVRAEAPEAAQVARCSLAAL